MYSFTGKSLSMKNFSFAPFVGLPEDLILEIKPVDKDEPVYGIICSIGGMQPASANACNEASVCLSIISNLGKTPSLMPGLEYEILDLDAGDVEDIKVLDFSELINQISER